MPCSVLVVDDDSDVREAMTEALAIAGYEAIGAENGAVALDAMRATRPSLVVVDLMMPVLDGWTLIDRMRADPALAEIPVCILSAVAADAPKDTACVLEKPVQLLRLLSTVQRYCG